MEISVIMPVFNAEDTLDEAIQSVLHQTFESFEFLIIDDGSKDLSIDIIKEWAQQDCRIIPIFNNHRGIVHTLNTGLEDAAGRYIARMDADDIAMPTRLEKQATFLNNQPSIGLVSCRVEYLGDKNSQKGYARYVRWINGLTSPEAIRLNRFIESPVAHPSVTFRKALIDQFGAYREGDFPEDYELWLRWLSKGVQMQKLPKTLLKWRDNEGRLSRNHPRYSTRAFYKIKAKYLARWLKKQNPNHPYIVVWGAGRTSRKRAELLMQYGIQISHYIDVDPQKIGQEIHGRPVWSPEDIPKNGARFIVSFVGNRGVNKQIYAYLAKRDYILGKHFIFAA